MNLPFASFGWETGAGILAVLLAGGLGLGGIRTAWRWHLRHRDDRLARERFRQMTALMVNADHLLWEAEVRLDPGQWAWDVQVHPSALGRRIFGEHMPTRETGLWNLFAIADREEMDRRARRAMEAGESSYEQEFQAARAGHSFWMREQVSVIPLGRNRFQLVGFVTDTTARHQVDPAQREVELTVERILEHAQCLIWRATVILLKNGKLHWAHFDIPQTQFSELLLGDRVYSPENGFWENMKLPQLAEMDERSTRAILGGDAEYTQQFSAINRDGRVFWLNENVSIVRAAEGIWSLVGVLTDTTAQHDAETAKRQSETRLAYLLERANCLVWEASVTLHPDDTLQWTLNTQRSMLYRRIFGDHYEGQLNWHSLPVPELPEMAARALAAIKARAPGYTQEFHVERPDGDIWLRESVTLAETSPSVFRLVGVVIDITAQHRAEEAQHQSEVRLTVLLERADCMVWQGQAWQTPTGAFLWKLFTPKSQLFRRLFGRDPDSAQQHQFEWLGAVPELEEMHARSQRAMLGGHTGYEQVFRYRLSGAEIWLNEKVTIRPLGPGHWELVGITTDITPQHDAEVALAAEKERLSVTLRAMSESVITTDVAGVVQFMNPAAAALTGWAEAEACGRPVAEICRLESVRSGDGVDVPVARVARGDVVAELPGQTRLVSRTNQRRQVEGCCAPIHAVDSKVIGAVLVLRDVTAQERLEQELVRATRLESVGVLAGGIAHDFNNILTAVVGNLTLAQLDIAADSPAASSLRSAEKAAVRARDLTQQLLTFAKGGEPVRAAVQLDAIVREMTSFALHGSQVKAAFDLAPDLWPADADKGQIGRVVQNIVINAVQAMRQGGTLRIMARNDLLDEGTVPGLAAGRYVQIAISDTGEGIPSEHLARIFDPYFTTKQTGTGLGLAAVYSIVRKHCGHIDVESQVGQGTTFRIWLPALLDKLARAESRQPWKPGRLQGRVLFMDDEKIIRDLATTLLQRFGLEVECALDGAEAIEKYRAARAEGRPHDLVIMDLTIPGGMGGLATIGELRAIDPGVKAIVSSGYSSDPVMANYRAHGFSGMVAKPYEVNEFARVLRELLPGEGEN